MFEFSSGADQSLSEFDEAVVSGILDFLEEAADEGFYNHESYSFVYDHHGNAWDKLDAKRGELNHRIFFREIDGTVYILDIFHRDEMDYEEHGLYHRLQRLADREQ